MTTVLSTAMKSTPLHIGFAFVAMGSWAMFANAAYPMPRQLLAGLVQGSISACLTLFLKHSVDWMRPRFSHGLGHIAPALLASLASACLLVTAHWLADTPEVIATIAVPLLVSATYIFSYNFVRQRAAKDTSDE